MDLIRIPPNNVDAELSVLASMLCDEESTSIAANILNPEDFYNPGNAEIYAAMIAIYKKNMPVDVITLRSELTQRGTLEQIGNAARISDLIQRFYTSVNIKYHVIEVKRQSEARQILKELTNLLQKPDNVTIDDLHRVTQMAEERQYSKSYAEKAKTNINEFKRNIRVEKKRISTGFRVMDAITGGFRIPSVVMIGAYPSVGKTAFALNIASNQESPVVFFSLEMSNDMIFERLASARLKIDYNLFTKQHFSDSQYDEIENFADELTRKQFHVFDDCYYIEQQATIILNIKPSLVVVDYIQKVKTHTKTDGRRHEIDFISGMYKQLAKNNNCTILLLSQLSRSMVSQTKPTMSNLKESGALEADGDYVGILHRPYVMQKDNPGEVRPEDGYILIDKNKFGNTGQIDLHFEGRYQQFYEVDKYATPPVGKVKCHNKDKIYQETLPVRDDELPFL